MTSFNSREKSGKFGVHKVVLLACVIISFSTEISSAQTPSAPQPPVTIGGFSYNFIPRGRIHMFVCRNPACVLGSKVSYSLFSPSSNPDFEQFKLAQEQVLSHLRARSPTGTTIKLGKIERTSDQLLTIFTGYREIEWANGSKLFTKSTQIYNEHITISLISSSEEEQAAETNGAQFLAGLLIWSGSQSKERQ